MSIRIVRPAQPKKEQKVIPKQEVKPKTEQKFVVYQSSTLKIFTDGSFNEANRRLGYSVVYPQNETWNLSGVVGGCKRPDNNKAELYAIFKALHLASGMFQMIPDSKYKSIIIYTDSKESTIGIEHYNRTREYKATYVRTVDKEAKALYSKISDLIDELRAKNKPVSFKTVRGHQKPVDFVSAYNGIADELARAATRR